MVLEHLISPNPSRGGLQWITLTGMIYATIGFWLGIWIFKSHVSLVSVFLTVIASFPLFYETMRKAERKEHARGKGKLLWKEHSKEISVLFALFVGVMSAYFLWYVITPADQLTNVFGSQTEVIQGLRGFATEVPDGSNKLGFFAEVLLNNLSILLFCLLFSFLYGAGAVFIIIWNASVIGVAIGNFVRTGLSQTASYLGMAGAGQYLSVVSLGLVRYSLHGIPEIIAYLIAGLAGGLISMGIVHSRGNLRYIKEMLADVFELTGVAVLLLVAAAWIEAFVSTVIF